MERGKRKSDGIKWREYQKISLQRRDPLSGDVGAVISGVRRQLIVDAIPDTDIICQA